MKCVTALLIALVFLEIGLCSGQRGILHTFSGGKRGILDSFVDLLHRGAQPGFGAHKITRRSIDVDDGHGIARPPSGIAASLGVVKK